MTGPIQIRLQRERDDFRLDVELSLPVTGVTAVFGRSGAGKTSLLRAVAGLDRSTGAVRIGPACWQDDAAGVFLPAHRRAVGWVPQSPSLFSHLNVRGNIRYGLRRVPAANRRVAEANAIEWLGLAPLLGRRPDTLSGGERQRVAIARALLASPDLLLLDEPVASLDTPARQAILRHLGRVREALDIPVLLVTHAMDDVARLADHLVWLDAGQVLGDGPLQRMLTRPDLADALGDEAGAVLVGTVREHDATDGLTRLDSPAGPLWVQQVDLPEGTPLRVQVLARDVSLALEPESRSSILNELPLRVAALHTAGTGAQVLVQLAARDASDADPLLIARITRRSAGQLELAGGTQVFARVKSVCLRD